jgi:heat shock protein HtpX
MPVDENAVVSHTWSNLLASALLVLGMGLLLLLLGYLMWGSIGAIYVVALGLLLVLLGPRMSPAMVLRMYGARPLHPAELHELHGIVEILAERARLPRAPRLYYVPTRILNAFSVGRPQESAIGITDGLLRRLSLRELAGVLAHEVSHIRHNDVWVMGLADTISRITSALSTLGQLLLLFSLPMALAGMVEVAWLPILLLLAAPTLSGLMQLALSRTRELDADLGAVQLTGDPIGLAAALEKLERQERNLWAWLFPGRGNPEPSVLRTHPNTRERVARLLELAGRQPPEPSADLAHPHGLELPSAWPRVTRPPRWHVSGLWH